MGGASRASYAELRERLAAVAVGPATSEQIGDQLFAVVRLLDAEHPLRRALADTSKPSEEKAANAQLAIEAFTFAAQYGGTLDDLEDDLFRFGRLVSGQPNLREALVGAAPLGAKTDL